MSPSAVPARAVRLGAGLAAAAAVAALGGLILGEYEFEGVMPYATAVLFGLVVSEVAVSVGRRRAAVVGLGCGGFTAGGLLWAAWISTGSGLRPLPVAIWPAMVLGAVVAAVRGGRWRWRRSPAAVAVSDPAP